MIFVFPVKRQHKERGGKRGWTAEVDGRAQRWRCKEKKNIWAKKRKEKENGLGEVWAYSSI